MKYLWIFIIFAHSVSFAQSNEYLVFFKNKEKVNSSLVKESFSEKALLKKEETGYDYYDYPISINYLGSVKNHGAVVNKSRWLNGIHYKSDLSLDEIKNSFSFVTDVIKLNPISKPKESLLQETEISASTDSSVYGSTFDQLEMTNTISCLHNKNLKGDGVLIAVLDAGFPELDSMLAFKKLRDSGRIIDSYDFEDNAPFAYHKSTHGTYVSTILTADLDSTYIGSAPKANYAFYITEIARFERNIEEFNLVLGLERADSIGADICSISLGYRNFDTLQVSYGYTGMDGRTTIASQGAAIAQRKGMIISVAAGNKGSGAGTLVAPCDTDSVLCVGAVKLDRSRAGFSSEGPSFDGRIKPDVMTVGEGCAFVGLDDTVRWGNGTSFATPLMSGMVACLKQAHPLRSNHQIINAIKANSHESASPNSVYGWGIPDACKVDSALSYLDSVIAGIPNTLNPLKIQIYPNPANELLTINTSEILYSIQIYTSTGKLVKSINLKSVNLSNQLSLHDLNKGIYLLKIMAEDGRVATKKIIKN
ncbi:MAG: S8/S53 family peptidase [Flavobacteriales bacterium]